MQEIIDVGYALHHWFSRHNIPKDGVRVIIQVPGRRSLYYVENSLKLDAIPEMVSEAARVGWKNEITVCEIPLAFEAKE